MNGLAHTLLTVARRGGALPPLLMLASLGPVAAQTPPSSPTIQPAPVAPVQSAPVPTPVPAPMPPQAAAGPPLALTVRQGPAVTVDVDKAQLILLPGPPKTVFVANPEIADIQVPTASAFLIYGKKAGETTVYAITETGATISYSVRVTRPAGEIASAVRAAVPDARVNVVMAPGGVTISGSVDSPRDAERLKAAARQFLGDKENINFDVAVTGATQVTLRVRVAEVSRNVDKELGVNWNGLFSSGTLAVGLLTGRTPLTTSFGQFVPSGSSSTYGSIGAQVTGNGGKVNVSSLVDALDQQGLATILAEPTLTAVSGETAKFLAGGQYPIPVPQGNQTVTIEYKQYGVSVEFTPTVLDANRISIKVHPVVSALTTVGELVLNGVAVPALTTREAETTVELGSGESFAIAGLFQNNGSNQISALPGLGDVPILGALFRSTSFQRNESELVIIVTPYLVHPVAKPGDLQLPTQGLRYSSDLERILKGRLTAATTQAATRTGGEPRLQGAAGFMVE